MRKRVVLPGVPWVPSFWYHSDAKEMMIDSIHVTAMRTAEGEEAFPAGSRCCYNPLASVDGPRSLGVCHMSSYGNTLRSTLGAYHTCTVTPNVRETRVQEKNRWAIATRIKNDLGSIPELLHRSFIGYCYNCVGNDDR